MTELNQHAVMIRDLVNHHAENINGKVIKDKLNKEICEGCFIDTLKPKDARSATYQTHLPPKIG